jgi:hypothetical protein
MTAEAYVPRYDTGSHPGFMDSDIQPLVLLPDIDSHRFVSEEQQLRAVSKEWLLPSKEKAHPTGLNLINTRLWLDELSKNYDRPITVGEIPDAELDKIVGKYDSLWFMGIYTPSEASKNHAKKWADQYKYAIPDIDPEKDVVASPFAIPEYTPNPKIANGWEEWDAFVDKLHSKGENVFLDFVPNHIALDHPWVEEHPEYFIHGTEQQQRDMPGLYHTVIANDGKLYHYAHGKDPNYPEWADTLQLNYAHPQVQQAMQKQLLDLVEHADGVRCDMAMLLNPDTFLRTWGRNYNDDGEWTGMDHLSNDEKMYISQTEFWPTAIAAAKEKAKTVGKKDFLFAAEAYWDMEKLGKYFDYIYGKDLYDHLRKLAKGEANESPDNLKAHLWYLMHAVREGRHWRDVNFTENHDEERAVKVFGEEPSKAAAAITAFIPDAIFLLNQGQENGSRIRPPMQIGRFPEEPSDERFVDFYDRLLTLKNTRLFQEGEWNLAELTWNNQDIIAQQVKAFESVDTPENIIYLHEHSAEKTLAMGAIVCTNFGRHTGSARLPEVTKDMDVQVVNLTKGRGVENIDMERDSGLYIELLPWETQIVFFTPKKHEEQLAA